jgi:hypothetical protein
LTASPKVGASDGLEAVGLKPDPRAAKFDSTGRYLAYAITGALILVLVGAGGAIVLHRVVYGDLDQYLKIAVPALASLAGTAVGFYLRIQKF